MILSDSLPPFSKKNAWLVAPFFPPSSAIAAERAKRICDHLTSNGYSVTLFLPETHPSVPEYVLSDDVAIVYFRVLFPQYLRPSSCPTKLQVIQLFLAKLLTFILSDHGWSYLLGLHAALLAASRLSGLPQLAIATGPPFLTFIPVTLICTLKQVRCWLDYRDSWSSNPSRSLRYNLPLIPLILEPFINTAADTITAASINCGLALRCFPRTSIHTNYNIPSKEYIERVKKAACNTHLIPHLDPGLLHLVYTGSLYSHITLDPLFQAISLLSSAHRSSIRIHYCGNHPNRATRAADSFGLTQILINYGSCSKEFAASLTKASDLCIAVTNSQLYKRPATVAETGEIPTKIFDYMILSKPILHISPADFEICQLLESIGYPSVETFSPDHIQPLSNLFTSVISDIPTWRLNAFQRSLEKSFSFALFNKRNKFPSLS